MSDPAELIATLVSAFERTGVPYMLAGSFAGTMHGAPRATQDIDIVIDPTFESLDRLLQLLASPDTYLDEETAREEFRRRGQVNAIDLKSGWKVDLIFRKARAFSVAEMSRRVPVEILGVRVFVATAEDTVVAKLEWAKLGDSERQLDDVRRIVEVKAESLDQPYIERWVDDLGLRAQWERIVQR